MFYDFKLYLTRKEESKNELGQLITLYKKSSLFCTGDIQPLSRALIDKEWGKDIDGSCNFFSSAFLNLNDVLIYDNKAYKIVESKDWIDYRVYLLQEVDLKWLE